MTWAMPFDAFSLEHTISVASWSPSWTMSLMWSR
jgi:hypothetical protein